MEKNNYKFFKFLACCSFLLGFALVSVQAQDITHPAAGTSATFNVALSSTVMFYDNGGPGCDDGVGSYPLNDAGSTSVICPDGSGSNITIEFLEVDIETRGSAPCWDQLTVHDGDNTGAPVLFTGCGEEGWQDAGCPGGFVGDGSDAGGVEGGPNDIDGSNDATPVNNIFTSTHASGCLTVHFTSDGSIDQGGWIAEVTASGGTPPPPPGGDECGEFVLDLTTDNFGGETSWEITDAMGSIVASGDSYSSNSSFTEMESLDDGCYDFTIYDAFDDGICCTFGTGSYSIALDGTELASGGDFASSETTSFCVACDGPPPPVEGELPYPWEATSIGSGFGCDNFGFDEGTNEFALAGCGNNAFPMNADNVAFANQTICGDGEISVKIESITNNGYAGLMIRETEDLNSKQVSIFSDLTNSLRHETRYSPGANKVVQNFIKPAPYWLKLQRQGDWVFAYYSSNGMSYQYVHAVYVPMGYCVEVGMAAFTYLPAAVATATFSNVNVVGSPAPAMETPGIEIADMDRQQAARLFPNPAQSNVTVEFAPNAEASTYLTLRNELGQVIEQRQLEPAAFRTEWTVESLNNGVYFIEINRDGEVPQVLRFVKAN